jgi:hypothetical protein
VPANLAPAAGGRGNSYTSLYSYMYTSLTIYVWSILKHGDVYVGGNKMKRRKIRPRQRRQEKVNSMYVHVII